MDEIDELLTRGVEKIYPSKEELEKVLRSGKKIRLYNGIDPTGPFLHLGHMVVLKKLRQFQDLGHKVILLIGDFTGMIGDPSGKSGARKPMAREELVKNAKTYRDQASKILRFDGENSIEIKFNSEWLDKLSFAETMKLASLVTYSQVIERDMFQKRMKEGKDLFVNEILYPLMQGYDSVVMDVDLEVGGSDQIFNMLMGRTLMRKMKGKDKFVLATKLLAEPGKEKMGKTENNFIALTEKPNEMFGKIMAWPDAMLISGFELLTDLPTEEVQGIAKSLEDGENPMVYKKKLAFTLTTMLNNNESAQKAQEEFEKVVQKKELPSEIGEITLSESFISGGTISDVILEAGLASSKSEAKRLISQGGTEVGDQVITDPNTPFNAPSGTVIRVGKRKFAKIIY